MNSVEIGEIKRRTEIISAGVIEKLQSDLYVLHHKNAAAKMLRSGGTVKESANIARASIRSYFDQIEQFVCARPDAKPGFDGTIIESISKSTSSLINAINDGLLKTANLAGDPQYVRAVEPEVTAELSAAQDTFRSNLRAHWAKNASHTSLSGADRLIFGIELACLVVSLAMIGAWIQDRNGPWEQLTALFALGFASTEIYRRYFRRPAP